MPVKGTIIKIERFAIHDGPGIRTVIFMKGCTLKCSWCSSPESQGFSPEMGYSVEKCVGCGTCVAVCPVKAIKHSDNGKMVTGMQLCNHCGDCVEGCPYSARKMIGDEVTVDEMVLEVGKDLVFYHNSGGGGYFKRR